MPKRVSGAEASSLDSPPVTAATPPATHPLPPGLLSIGEPRGYHSNCSASAPLRLGQPAIKEQIDPSNPYLLDAADGRRASHPGSFGHGPQRGRRRRTPAAPEEEDGRRGGGREEVSFVSVSPCGIGLRSCAPYLISCCCLAFERRGG
jgi:hypothetical protein